MVRTFGRNTSLAQVRTVSWVINSSSVKKNGDDEDDGIDDDDDDDK